MAPISPDDLSTDEMIKHIFSSVNRMEATLNTQQQKITKLESNVDALNKQVFTLQNIVNSHEQEMRGLSVRITGFPYLDDEKASPDSILPKRLYERILAPILNHAKSVKHIDKVPSLINTVARCYRVGNPASPTNTATPPPIVLKFSNDTVRLAVLRNKRLHTPVPSPEEKLISLKRFNISEDLTIVT